VSVTFNGGPNDGGGDLLRIAGDGLASGTYTPSSTQPHAGKVLVGGNTFDFTGVEPLVVHDMERVCALCESKRECDHDLASGASAEHYQEYVLNAPRIAQLHETWSWVTTPRPRWR